MKITVVTISFNQAAFLERAMLSVLEQDYLDLEYIVVDPGSTDGSRAIIERLRPRLSHVILEPDNGPADGLNRGFAHAAGDIYCFVNADDALLPGALRYVANYFQKFPDIGVLLGAGFAVDAQDLILRRILPTPFTVRRYLTGGFEFIQQGMFFRKEAFLSAGGFNVQNSTCWDGELLLDMGLANTRVGHCEVNLGLFRLHQESISGSGRLKEAYMRDLARMFQKGMGRERNVLDWMLGFLYRVHKIARAPGFYFARFCSTIAGRLRTFSRT